MVKRNARCTSNGITNGIATASNTITRSGLRTITHVNYKFYYAI